VQRQTVQVLRAEAAGDAVGEVDVGGFGLAVGCPGLVGVRFREVEIVRAGWSYAVMTREPEVDVAEERRRGLRRLKRRKWERWLVANWVSKPSTVLP
jgi:hypothetical protein